MRNGEMEPPLKRCRLSCDNEEDFAQRKKRNDLRLKSAFEAIYKKYSKDFSNIGDEIDLETGKIVVNNGHLLSMRDEQDEDGCGNVMDELCESNYSGHEGAYKATASKYEYVDNRILGTGDGFIDTDELLESTMLHEHAEIQPHYRLNSSGDKHDRKYHLIDARQMLEVGMGKASNHGSASSTLQDDQREQQASHVQDWCQDFPMNHVNDGSEPKDPPLPRTPLPPLHQAVSETVSKVFTSNQAKDKDASWLLQQLGVALQLVASGSLPSHALGDNSQASGPLHSIALRDESKAFDLRQNTASRHSSKVSITSLLPSDQMKQVNVDIPDVNHTVAQDNYLKSAASSMSKGNITKTQNSKRPATIPWTKDEDELLVRLKSTTNMTSKQITANFNGRSCCSIQTHWAVLRRSVKMNAIKPHLKETQLASAVAATAKKPRELCPNNILAESTDTNSIAVSPPKSPQMETTSNLEAGNSTLRQTTKRSQLLETPNKLLASEKILLSRAKPSLGQADCGVYSTSEMLHEESTPSHSEKPSHAERKRLSMDVLSYSDNNINLTEPHQQRILRTPRVVIERLVPLITNTERMLSKQSKPLPLNSFTPTSKDLGQPRSSPDPDTDLDAPQAAPKTSLVESSSMPLSNRYLAGESKRYPWNTTLISKDLNIELDKRDGDLTDSQDILVATEASYTDFTTGLANELLPSEAVLPIAHAESTDLIETKAQGASSNIESGLKRSTPLVDKAILAKESSSPRSTRRLSLSSAHITNTASKDSSRAERKTLTSKFVPGQTPSRRTRCTTNSALSSKRRGFRSRHLICENDASLMKSPLDMDNCLNEALESSNKHKQIVPFLDTSECLQDNIIANEETVIESDRELMNLRSSNEKSLNDNEDMTKRSTHQNRKEAQTVGHREDLSTPSNEGSIGPRKSTATYTFSPAGKLQQLKANPTTSTSTTRTCKSRSLHSRSAQKSPETVVLPLSAAEDSIWEITDSEAEAEAEAESDSPSRHREPKSPIHSHADADAVITPVRTDGGGGGTVEPAQDFEDLPIRSAHCSRVKKTQSSPLLSRALITAAYEDLSEDELCISISNVVTPVSREKTVNGTKHPHLRKSTGCSSSPSVWS